MKDPKGRKTVGFEKHIFVCENTRINHPRGCCKDKGSSEIRLMFKNEIEKQKMKGRVRANSAGCLDFCEQGPTVVVYPESVWYSIKNPKKDVPEIVKEHLINGKIVKRCLIEI